MTQTTGWKVDKRVPVQHRWTTLRRFSIRIVVLTLVPVTLLIAPPVWVSDAQTQECVSLGIPRVPTPWPQEMLDPQQVWPISTGDGQRVAVVSTGIAETPFLEGRLVGSVDVSPPPEFGKRSGRPDCLGNGTGAAGIIAGSPISGAGFTGVAPDAELLSAKVVGDQYYSRQEPRDSVAPTTLASAVDWAIRKKASVIVVADITYELSGPLRSAIKRALEHDIVVVAPVGDLTEDPNPWLTPYPAAFNDVIGVAAIDADGSVADSSLDRYVDIVAPGNDVVVTRPRGGLGLASGGQFAAGFVGGTVALIRSRHPSLSREQVVHRLFATAAPAHEGDGSDRYGHGIASPYAAVVEETVAGEPVPLPNMVVASPTADELRRQAAWQSARSLAHGLAIAGLAVIGIATVLVALGPRGRRRRWRCGLTAPPRDRGEDDLPEPPLDLLDDWMARPNQGSRHGG